MMMIDPDSRVYRIGEWSAAQVGKQINKHISKK